MAISDHKVVQIRELRFKPANSNERARAGLEHAFKDVPPCSFARDDGISPYIGSDSTIGTYPQTPVNHEVLHESVPAVAEVAQEASASLAHKLLRSGFALSVFAHVLVAAAIGYLTISLPDDSALMEGETVLNIEFYSDNDSEVTTRVQRDEQEGEVTPDDVPEEQVEKPVVKQEAKPKIEPKVVERPKLPEPEKPLEQVKQPEPVKVPEKAEEPVIGTDVPDVLSTTAPSSFQVQAAAKQILDTTPIEPLPEALPLELTTPVVEETKPEPVPVKSLAHPVSKQPVIEKVAEAKPVEKPMEQPVAKKEEPKPVEKKPEPKPELKKPEPKPVKKVVQKAPDRKPVKKKVERQDGNADANNDKGKTTAKNKGSSSREASQGNSKNRTTGNASSTNYKGLIQKRLSRAKDRVRVGAKGKVTVSFTITANGGVSNLRIKASSGKPAIDKGALDVVRRAMPFPAIPADANRSTWPMSVPMTFKGN